MSTCRREEVTQQMMQEPHRLKKNVLISWTVILLSVGQAKGFTQYCSPSRITTFQIRKHPFCMNDAGTKPSLVRHNAWRLSQTVRLSTKLAYRDGDDLSLPANRQVETDRTGSSMGQWWQSIFGSEVGSDKSQIVIDDYLEFIDRRYTRLYGEEDVQPVKDVSDGRSTAWQWLVESASNKEEEIRKKNALHVLGLAELASIDLLKRHHIRVPAQKKRETRAIEAAATPVAATESMVSAVAKKIQIRKLAASSAALVLLTLGLAVSRRLGWYSLALTASRTRAVLSDVLKSLVPFFMSMKASLH